MGNMIRWLFSIFIANLSIVEGLYSGRGPFCQNRVGSNVQKLTNSTQDPDTVYLIIKLGSDELIDLDYASKVCKQCHDAQVISLPDALNLPHNSLPTWINLTAHMVETGYTQNVTWDEFANWGNLTQEEILWVQWLPSLTAKYALLFMPPNKATNVRYVAFPQEDFYYGSAAAGRASNDIFVARTIVCRRQLMRDHCHYWTIEDERCIFHPKFGCHRYTEIMSRPPDVADYAIECTKFRRTVKSMGRQAYYHEIQSHERPLHMKITRCPMTKCSCSVTSWSEWSLCDEKYCTTRPGNRTRHRQVVQPCSIGWVHEILNQLEPCSMPENCHLLANNFTMNESLILFGST